MAVEVILAVELVLATELARKAVMTFAVEAKEQNQPVCHKNNMKDNYSPRLVTLEMLQATVRFAAVGVIAIVRPTADLDRGSVVPSGDIP